MKKIFVIEINEKDKNIENEEIINDLEQQFNEFSDKIRSNKNLYIRTILVSSQESNNLIFKSRVNEYLHLLSYKIIFLNQGPYK